MMKMRYLLGPACAILAAWALPVSCYRTGSGGCLRGRNGPPSASSVDDVLREVGASSNYWSSTADTEYPVYAWYMFTKKDRYVGEYRSGRYYGHSVRPVAEI